ncbi:MAG: PA2779 family protein [Nitrospiraceae bacterium]|nr:PA2779 family protein [Nitrospiraceae bacterium]
MRTAFYTKPLSLYLILALLALTSFAGPAEAMMLPADHAAAPASPERAADLSRIQKGLESKALEQRLQDYGLTSQEAMAKISTLSDEQVHQLASQMDSVQAGGDGLIGFMFGLAILAGIVILIIYLLEGRIVIQKA